MNINEMAGTALTLDQVSLVTPLVKLCGLVPYEY